jgi:hypothetical protein
VRGVGRDVDDRAGARALRLAAERQLDLAVENGEHLLEVVPVQRRTAARRHQHVDQRVAAPRLRAVRKNGVGAAGHRDGARSGRIDAGHCERT